MKEINKFVEAFNENCPVWLHIGEAASILCDTIQLDERDKDTLKCFQGSRRVARIDLNNSFPWFVAGNILIKYQQGKVVKKC